MFWLLSVFACQPEVEQLPQVAVSVSEIDFAEAQVVEDKPYLKNQKSLTLYSLCAGGDAALENCPGFNRAWHHPEHLSEMRTAALVQGPAGKAQRLQYSKACKRAQALVIGKSLRKTVKRSFGQVR